MPEIQHVESIASKRPPAVTDACLELAAQASAEIEVLTLQIAKLSGDEGDQLVIRGLAMRSRELADLVFGIVTRDSNDHEQMAERVYGRETLD